MYSSDIFALAAKSIVSQRLRSLLILAAMSIGVAAIIVLIALGESARLYVTGKFSALGTNLLIVLPGRSETTGGQPPLLGETPRDLTLNDALALLRSRFVAKIAPLSIGSAPISKGQRERDATIMGSNADLRTVRHLNVGQGRFLPNIPLQRAMSVCVIGHKIRIELFGSNPALGQWLRIGDRRFRVIGVLASEGQSVGVDFDEVAIIPVASAQALFNSPSLFRIFVVAKSRETSEATIQDITRIIKARHEGEDDITVIAQDSVVNTFDEILTALTLSVTGIAAISLAVAGILIMNVMLVSVSQRTAEIGLFKAIGAASPQLKLMFITEAALLSVTGAVVGLILGYTTIIIADRLYSTFSIEVPLWAPLLALTVSLLTGLLSGYVPAARAAKLDPIQALAKR